VRGSHCAYYLFHQHLEDVSSESQAVDVSTPSEGETVHG
jgi:hypothetical protein